MKYALGDHRPQMTGDDCWVAPNATLIGDIIMEKDSSVWFGAVLRGDNEPIRLGEGTNIQDNSVLHADPGFPLTLERHVTVGHMVMLHGCTIGAGSLIGVGAIVLNGAVIGANCLLGASALIPEGKEIPPNSVVMGAPGKVVREVGEREQEMLDFGWQHYVKRYKRYRDDLREDV